MAQQNLDFNIAANVKGMEAIATLINRVGALEAETKKLASANSALSTSTDAVIRNGTRYNNALDAQSKELRNARQGTQQLGMQINDFATSVSTGSSITQAFNQQIGQVGYAMSMMGGTAGRVGNFLAGPWGAAITIGAMALTPLIQKLWETFNGANAAGKALTDLIKKRQAFLADKFALNNAEKDLTKLIKRRGELEAEIAKQGRRDANGNLMFVYRQQKELAEVNKLIAEGRDAVDAERTSRLGLDLEPVARDLFKQPEIAKVGAGGGKSIGKSAAEEAEKARERLAEIERDIERIRYKGDQAMREELSKLSNDQEAKLQETLKSAEEMGMAAAQTLSDKVIKPFITQLEELDKSYQRIGGAVSDAFKGMLTGAMSWKDGMRGIINAVIDELWRLYVVQQIVGMVTKFLGAIGLPVPGLAGARAAGGPVSANKPYLVGEKGPEIVVPGKSGTVIPNRSIGQTGGGGTIINVDARGASDPAAVRAQVQQGIIEAAPSIIAAAQATTIKSLRRPRLGGAIK